MIASAPARGTSLVALLVLTLGSVAPLAAQGVLSTASAPFLNFESGPVRPLLLSPDGETLYALNTPDHRVEVYATGVAHGATQLKLLGSVFTGLEPVSMALHPDDGDLLFVANALSDDVAVVHLPTRRVLATVPVGDEPTDVLVVGDVLAVATSRSAATPDLLRPEDFVEHAVVLVDAQPPFAVTDRIAVPGHMPWALAEAEGQLFVIPRNSGNHTSVLSEVESDQVGLVETAPDAFDEPFEINPALLRPEFTTLQYLNQTFGEFGWAVPDTGRIVNDDEYPAFTPALADADLIPVDLGEGATAAPITGVGTTLLAVARNPATGELWVANTDAANRTRFEPRLKGAAVVNRITRVDPTTGVTGVIALAPPLTARPHAQPTALAFAEVGDQHLAYVAALGTATVIVLDAVTGALVTELDTSPLPMGLAVDDAYDRLYVFTRADNAITTWALDEGHARFGRPRRLAYDPEPAVVSAGRVHMYDARGATGAGNGVMSCATCHVFGHTDALAWDLGDPEGGLGYFAPDLMQGPVSFGGEKVANKKAMLTHPMKGPMVTQSLRGMGQKRVAPLHWRGDRRFFHMFRGAFRGLLGGTGISPRAMQEFASFTSTMVWPPNPFQPRDRQYRDEEAHGRDLYGLNPEGAPGKEYNPLIPGNVTCITCHKADFVEKDDFSGSQRTVNFDAEPQLFNTATLRGVYEKEFPELTGFGVLHDGSIDDILGFMNASLGGTQAFPSLTAQEKSDVADFVRAWDSGLSPLVGVQHTHGPRPVEGAALSAFLDLARAQARPPHDNVDLIARFHATTWSSSPVRGAVYEPVDEAAPEGPWTWTTDTGRRFEDAEIEALLAGGGVMATFTVVPPGQGRRLGVDRDEDGLPDGLEATYGSSPHDPDTDDDGFADGLELVAGGHLRQPDASLPGDVTAPSALVIEARDVFADTATLHVVADEAAEVTALLGTTPGGVDLGSVDGDGLRVVHDLVLSDLPAATTVHVTLSLRDGNGQLALTSTSFETGPAMYHVADIQLEADAEDGQVTATARVTVVDQAGDRVPGILVKVIWAGDIGGQDILMTAPADEQGVATLVLGPYAPAGPTTLTVSPVHLGSNGENTDYFVGLGGDELVWYYNQSANAVNWRSVSVEP